MSAVLCLCACSFENVFNTLFRCITSRYVIETDWKEDEQMYWQNIYNYKNINIHEIWCKYQYQALQTTALLVLISSSSGLMSLVHHHTNTPVNKDIITYVMPNTKTQQEASPNNVKNARYWYHLQHHTTRHWQYLFAQGITIMLYIINTHSYQ